MNRIDTKKNMKIKDDKEIYKSRELIMMLECKMSIESQLSLKINHATIFITFTFSFFKFQLLYQFNWHQKLLKQTPLLFAYCSLVIVVVYCSILLNTSASFSFRCCSNSFYVSFLYFFSFHFGFVLLANIIVVVVNSSNNDNKNSLFFFVQISNFHSSKKKKKKKKKNFK